jgi:hypothetical protein
MRHTNSFIGKHTQKKLSRGFPISLFQNCLLAIDWQVNFSETAADSIG